LRLSLLPVVLMLLAACEGNAARAPVSGNDANAPGSAPKEASPSTAPAGSVPAVPAAPPKPAPLVAPDGTVALDCATAPAGMACIPGGPATRGFDGPDICPQPENPPKPVNHQPSAQIWLQTYYMDVTEVTFEAYKSCEAAGRCNKAGPRYGDFSRPKQPMIGANWYDASKYCEAQGKHLPTEAEWEKAARGPDGELEPWGNEPATCDRAVIMNEAGQRSCGVKKRGDLPEKGRTWEVAQKPVGRYGLYDMAGNGEEWVADWYAPTYAKCGEPCLGTNPEGPCKNADKCPGYTEKIVKGGSWFWPGSCATGYNRRPHVPSNNPYHHFGFRCAASTDEAARMASPQAPAGP
jgi:formylglycine-generating enzyme